MSNPRDTGRYDAFTDSWVDQQVRVDFAWGNIPMQPNDDRGEDTLDPTLDSHIIATSGYENFPAFTTGGIYDDTIANVEVPNLVGMLTGLASAAVDALGLNYSVDDSRVTGATVANDSHVYSQTPAAGTVVNAGSTVYTVIYEAPLVPNLVGLNNSQAEAALIAAGLVLGTSTPSTTGATSGNNGKVKSQSIAAGTQVDAGTTVNLTIYNYVVSINYNIAGIRATNPVDAHKRYLYLQGRNHNLTFPNGQITLHDTGVANYNRPFNILAIENDDAFNTGGTKVTITNGIMTGDGGDVTNTGTYTKDI